MPLKNQSSNSPTLKSGLTLKNLIPTLGVSLRRPETRKLIGAFVGWGGSLLFGITTAFFVVQVLDVRASIKSKELFVSILTQKYNAMLSLESSADILELNQVLMDSAMPSQEAVPELMGQIQKIATESGVSLRSLQYGGSSVSSSGGDSSESSFETVTMQVSGSAPLVSGLVTFLKNLESSSRVVSVRNVSFSQTDFRESSGVLVSLTIDAYYVSGEVAVPPVYDFSGNIVEPGDVGFTADTISKPLSFDITSPEFTRLIDFLKTLRVYKSDVQVGSVGKSNPFR